MHGSQRQGTLEKARAEPGGGPQSRRRANGALLDEFEVRIAARPEVVFDCMADAGLLRSWLDLRSARVEMSFARGIEVGDRIVIVPRLTGALFRMVVSCEAAERPRRIVWRFAEGPLHGTEAWTVEPGDGGCVARKTLDYGVSGVWHRAGWLLAGRAIHAWACHREFRALRALAEGRAG